MRHPAYTVRYSVAPTNSALLAIILYTPVSTTLVYNDREFSPFHDINGCVRLFKYRVRTAQ